MAGSIQRYAQHMQPEECKAFISSFGHLAAELLGRAQFKKHEGRNRREQGRQQRTTRTHQQQQRWQPAAGSSPGAAGRQGLRANMVIKRGKGKRRR